ncbi:MAG: hypothetical protein ACTHVJ_00190 [Lactobacillus delbrueckii]|jgi:ribosomal protein L14E/L6E/L27E|uniref:Uncharacterized protein n=1 Tax=Lactobacillus delbrueckii subsp. lactis TaxID=29397 RepID=A0ABD4SHK1_LACDL|nr:MULTISPECIES: hypothetical protein [Lactobacillus]MCD5486584.1 hypothetical protein [Lactobacillus delbrueckii subsp. lactis]MCD5561259.1 hypothetical protein [Lactobacillus delbrueckii subsp. lactis]MCD5563053.1 hypothetical protein [Lactobacillus delbrueckii subsp. lactis]OFS74041.1 hypothetical protein HMPREF3168_08115 [Lactobacillus sp. HMSC08B12]RZM13690.1 hypothetical protein LDELB18P2_1240 [Lactobacillus delbrueckii]
MADSARRRKKPRRLMMKLKQLWLTKKAVDQVNGQVKELTDADNEAKAASDTANKDLAAKKAAESEAEQEYQALPKVVANDALKRKN